MTRTPAPTTDGAGPLLSPRLAAVVRAAHETYFPAGGVPDPVPRLELVFSDAKREMRRGIVVLLWLFELGPLLYKASRFSRLPLPERTAWLVRLSRSKGGLARAIYAVLKVLLQSLAYDDPDLSSALVTPREETRA